MLSFYQNGVRNVVSSSGTALTEEQIEILKRYTPNITLLFDGDAAGLRASFRGLDMMLEQGVNVRVVSFLKKIQIVSPSIFNEELSFSRAVRRILSVPRPRF